MESLPEDLIFKITDYLEPEEFLNLKQISNYYYKICKNKKHIFLSDYYKFNLFFEIDDKTKLLDIQLLSKIAKNENFMIWLFYIVENCTERKCKIIYNLMWKVIISPYFIKNYCPTRYEHKSIVSRIRYIRDLIFESRIYNKFPKKDKIDNRILSNSIICKNKKLNSPKIFKN